MTTGSDLNSARPSNARKRVYGLLLACFLNGVVVGLLVAPTLAWRGLVAYSLLGIGLLVMGIAVTRWRDPV